MADNKNIQISTLFSNLEELTILAKSDSALAVEKAEASRLAIVALTNKVDAIKEMLDSATYGLQKMSSNLDDIMVKLDV